MSRWIVRLSLGALLAWGGERGAAGAAMAGPVGLASGLPDSPGQVVAGQVMTGQVGDHPVAAGPVAAAAVDPARTGSIAGIVTDTDKAVIPAAQVTLETVAVKELVRELVKDAETAEDSAAKQQAQEMKHELEEELAQEKAKAPEPAAKMSRTVSADGEGQFRFDGLAPGHYQISIHAPGFAGWKVEEIEVHAGESVTLPPVLLGVEEITSSVRAIFREDLAEEQISAEEKQRILGILPNFYVSYLSDAVSLTRKQKFKLAFRISRDGVTLAKTALVAGIEQAQGDFSGYGPGFSGYAKRYGATYGGAVSSTMLGAAILPSLFKQDPRYFYNGKGTVTHRALYAIATVVICKGDNGRWQPNYSNVLGNLGAGAITSLYYPKSDQKSLQVTLDNALIGTAEGAFGTLFQEFLLRRFTHGAP